MWFIHSQKNIKVLYVSECVYMHVLFSCYFIFKNKF